MDIIITNKLVNILLISTVFSVIQMTFIQKCKKFKCIKKECHILILNIVTSFIHWSTINISNFKKAKHYKISTRIFR